MKVWLDDERRPPTGWTWAFTVGEALDWLRTGVVDEISLDHDLGDDSSTGYDVLLWLEQRAADGHVPPRIYIHTANPPARKRMELAVASIERLALTCPP